jgi:hypothetical protein
LKKLKWKNLKLICLLIAAGLGAGLAFPKQVSAEDIRFEINLPGAQFDPNSLLSPARDNALTVKDRLINNGGTVLRTVQRRAISGPSGYVGAPPKMIGRAGYFLYNREWNSSPTIGGTLFRDDIVASSNFNQLFGRSANSGSLYLLWKTNNDKLTLTYDSASNGEVANPTDRAGKKAGEVFTDSDLPQLKRYGYNFTAWFTQQGNRVGTSKNGDNSIRITPVEADPGIYNGTSANASLISSELPLTAQWQKKTGNVKVEFWDGDGKSLYGKIDTLDIWDEIPLGAVNPVKDGFRLDSWMAKSGENLKLNESRTPASMDIELSPGGTLRLFANWMVHSKLTISYTDRKGNDLGIPSKIETVNGSEWAWKKEYEIALTDKLLAAYRVDGGPVIEGKPSLISLIQDSSLELIYGHDRVSSGGIVGSDGIEDFDIELSWRQEDDTSVNNQIAPKVITLNTGEVFAEKYDGSYAASNFKGLAYKGYYLNQDSNNLQIGDPSLLVNAPGQVTYVFRKKIYDLKIHFIDFKGTSLSSTEQVLSKEVEDGRDYFIDSSKLDKFGGVAPTGWYLGTPKTGTPNLAELYDMTKPLNVEKELEDPIDITIVFDDVLNVSFPLAMKFTVSNETTKAVVGPKYTITNNSSSSGLTVKLNPKEDVKISKNSANIQLIANPRQDNVNVEELYLTLKTESTNSTESALSPNSSQLTKELAAGKGMELKLSGKYFGELPNEKSPNKAFEGILTWHFSPTVK